MSLPVFVGAGAPGSNSSPASQLVLPLPEGVEAGHLLIAEICDGNYTEEFLVSVVPPEGWTLLAFVSANDGQTILPKYVFYKFAEEEEADPVFTFTILPADDTIDGYVVAFSGAGVPSVGTEGGVWEEAILPALVEASEPMLWGPHSTARPDVLVAFSFSGWDLPQEEDASGWDTQVYAQGAALGLAYYTKEMATPGAVSFAFDGTPDETYPAVGIVYGIPPAVEPPAPVDSAIDLSEDLGTGATTDSVNVTVPEGADTVLFGVRQYSRDQAATLNAITLGGNPPDATFISTPQSDYAVTAIAVWFNQTPGVKALQATFSHAPIGWGGGDGVGSRAAVVDFASGANAVRDGDAVVEAGETVARDFELETVSGDFVWKFSGSDGIPGDLEDGWTNRAAGSGLNTQGYRASYKVADGESTEVVTDDNSAYPSLAAIALYWEEPEPDPDPDPDPEPQPAAGAGHVHFYGAGSVTANNPEPPEPPPALVLAVAERTTESIALAALTTIDADRLTIKRVALVDDEGPSFETIADPTAFAAYVTDFEDELTGEPLAAGAHPFEPDEGLTTATQYRYVAELEADSERHYAELLVRTRREGIVKAGGFSTSVPMLFMGDQ